MTNVIPIAEQFYSIQGEGPHAGSPAIFLRLAGCNLCCGGWENATRDLEDMEAEGDATWYCDSIAVWREAESASPAAAIVDGWEAESWLKRLGDGAHLILTGGEPTMEVRQEPTVDLFAELARRRIYPTIEVETNGTVVPSGDYAKFVDLFNVSIKLANSGMARGKRINPEAIEFYNEFEAREDIRGRARYKFVVSDESEMTEIHELIDEYDIPKKMVSLMPAGQTQKELAETYPVVAELCKERNFWFSPRLHVNVWNRATGV